MIGSLSFLSSPGSSTKSITGSSSPVERNKHDQDAAELSMSGLNDSAFDITSYSYMYSHNDSNNDEGHDRNRDIKHHEYTTTSTSIGNDNNQNANPNIYTQRRNQNESERQKLRRRKSRRSLEEVTRPKINRNRRKPV